MPRSKPTIYIIGGCNGSGKTTFALEFLPGEVDCLSFLNPDLIASGVSPLSPATAATRAARILLHEYRSCLARRETFGLESTLSGLSYSRLFAMAKDQGYRLQFYYLWLPDPALAVRRVKERVRKGGHGIPAKEIRRRYFRSLRNLKDRYLPLADEWVILDNSGEIPQLVAKSVAGRLTVANPAAYNQIFED